MENLNLPPFYVGQKVIHVGTPYKFLGKNTPHVVNGVFTAPCGCVYLGIDNDYLSPVTTTYVECAVCGNKSKTRPTDRYGYEARDFRPMWESKFRAVSFQKIMEETEKICVN